jgi:hypothetical protein
MLLAAGCRVWACAAAGRWQGSYPPTLTDIRLPRGMGAQSSHQWTSASPSGAGVRRPAPVTSRFFGMT